MNLTDVGVLSSAVFFFFGDTVKQAHKEVSTLRDGKLRKTYIKPRQWMNTTVARKCTNTTVDDEGRDSSYSPFEVHICWKVRENTKNPPIHTESEQSP